MKKKIGEHLYSFSIMISLSHQGWLQSWVWFFRWIWGTLSFCISSRLCAQLLQVVEHPHRKNFSFFAQQIHWRHLLLLLFDISLGTLGKNQSTSLYYHSLDCGSLTCFPHAWAFSSPGQTIYLSLLFECHLLQPLATPVAFSPLNSLHFVLIPLALVGLNMDPSSIQKLWSWT